MNKVRRSGVTTGRYLIATREEMRKLDRQASEEYGVPSLILMENAGSGAARLIAERVSHGPLMIVCGRGNNGGDGFVIARHLYNQGIAVKLFFIGRLNEVPPNSDSGINLNILLHMGLEPHEIVTMDGLLAHESAFVQSEAIVDAIFGTGLTSNIREPELSMVQQIASWHRPSFAVDIPSGLDANTGEILGACLPAVLTISFCLPKQGFFRNRGPEIIGELAVVEISIPRALWKKDG